MSASAGKKGSLGREVSPGIIAVVGVLLLLVIGGGVYYFVNNGWDTPAQKEYKLEHEYYPLKALAHGDHSLFDAENALRRKEGKPLLVDDKNAPVRSSQDDAKIREENRKKALAAGGN